MKMKITGLKRGYGVRKQENRPAGESRNQVCVFNKTRQAFLGLSVRKADTVLSRLRGLLGKTRLRSGEGLWVQPSQGVHTIGLLFPIDVIYLDADNRVLLTVENLATFRISPVKSRCRSVLQFPTRTVSASGTQAGDQILICSPEGMEAYFATSGERPLEMLASRP
jgi:uncharacterized membrane protein (UPF0127 family)